MEAMGEAPFIDGEWESICKLLSFDLHPDPSSQLDQRSFGYDQDFCPTESLSELKTPQFLGQSVPLTPMGPNNDLSPLSCSSEILSSNSTLFDNETSQFSSIDDLFINDGLFMDNVNVDQCDQVEVQDDIFAPKKRSRVSSTEEKERKKTNTRKRKQEPLQEEEEMSICEEEKDDGFHENHLILKGKKRSRRGEATDPQSLYARKRRERINERLKVLQNLVPNGTKVDISTMLEEAVSYVKFMQLQIKLLSSDDMWMYAPLAYNGFDVGLYKSSLHIP